MRAFLIVKLTARWLGETLENWLPALFCVAGGLLLFTSHEGAGAYVFALMFVFLVAEIFLAHPRIPEHAEDETCEECAS